MSICPESRDDTHRTSMKIVQFSRLHIPLVNIRPIISHPLDPGRPISNELHPSITPPPPFQMITTQLKKQSKDDYYTLLGPSFRLAFVFSINSFILSGFPLTSFHLAEASLSAFFVALYSFACSYPFFNYSHF